MDEFTDKELIEQFNNPDTQSYAFNMLVRQYQKRLYYHIRRMVIDHDDANDILQNVFIKVWKNLSKFREDSNLYTWLYRIASNETITFLNKKNKRNFVSTEDAQSELANSIDNGSHFTGDEIQKKLQKAILTLPDKQREVFNLKYYEEMKYEQMSEVLDTSVGALKASYHHAVKKIEFFLKHD